MKALPRPDWNAPKNRELRIRACYDFKAIYEAYRAETQAFFFAAACLAAHEVFGAGEKRLIRFEDAFISAIREHDKNLQDDAPELLYRELRALGLDELADELAANIEESARAIEKTFLDIGDKK